MMLLSVAHCAFLFLHVAASGILPIPRTIVYRQEAWANATSVAPGLATAHSPTITPSPTAGPNRSGVGKAKGPGKWTTIGNISSIVPESCVGDENEGWSSGWCEVSVGTVEIHYFPTSAQPSGLVLPTTSYLSDYGVEITGPDVWYILQTAIATDWCGNLVGTTITDLITHYPITDVSTWPPYKCTGCTDRLYDATVPIQLELDDLTTCYQQPATEILDYAGLVNVVNNQYYNGCYPILVWPPDLLDVAQHAWSTCNIPHNGALGLFDPPMPVTACSAGDSGCLFDTGAVTTPGPAEAQVTPANPAHTVNSGPTPTAVPAVNDEAPLAAEPQPPSAEPDNSEAAPPEHVNPEAAPAEHINPEAAPAGNIDPQPAPAGNVNPQAEPAGNVDPQPAPAVNVDSQPAPAGNVDPQPAPAGNVNPQAAPAGNVDPQPAPAGNVNPQPAPAVNVDSQPAPAGNVDPQPAPAGNVNPQPAPAVNVDSQPAPAGNVDPQPAPAGNVNPQPAPADNASPQHTPVGNVSPGAAPAELVGPQAAPAVQSSPPPSVPSPASIVATVGSSIVSVPQDASTVVVGDQTATAGGPPITVSDQIVTLGPSNVVVSNTNPAVAATTFAPPTAPPPAPIIATVGSSIVSVPQDASTVVVGDQTATAGGSPITVSDQVVTLGPSGVIVSNTNPAVAATTYAPPSVAANANVANANLNANTNPLPASTVVNIDGQAIAITPITSNLDSSNAGLVNPGSNSQLGIVNNNQVIDRPGNSPVTAAVLGTQTLSLGGPAITLPGNQVASLSPVGVVIQAPGGIMTTVPVAALAASTSSPSTLTPGQEKAQLTTAVVAGNTVSAGAVGTAMVTGSGGSVGAATAVINGKTLSVGGTPVTLPGNQIASLSPDGVVVQAPGGEKTTIAVPSATEGNPTAPTTSESESTVGNTPDAANNGVASSDGNSRTAESVRSSANSLLIDSVRWFGLLGLNYGGTALLLILGLVVVL